MGFVVPNMPRRLHNQFTREEWVAKHSLSPKDQDRLREAIERRFLPEPPRKGARYAAASNAFKAKRKALVWRDAWGGVTDHRAAAEATILLNADEARDGLVAALRSLAEPDTLVKREVIAALEAGGPDKFRGYVYEVTFEDLKEANVERDSLLKASDRTIRRGKTRTQTVDKDGKTPRLATWGDVDDDGRSINYVAPKEKKESDDLRDERLDPEDATAEAQGTDLISLAERIAPAWAAHVLGKQGYKEVAVTFNLKNERAARRRVEKEWKDHLERLGFPLTLEPRGEDDPAAVKRAQRAKRAQANAEHQAWLESLGLRR